MSDVLFRILYFIFLGILIVYEFLYIRLKYIKKDERLKGVSFFKFLLDTREILKGKGI